MTNYYIQCNCGLKDFQQENWLLVVQAVTSKVIWVLVMEVFFAPGSLIFTPLRTFIVQFLNINCGV